MRTKITSLLLAGFIVLSQFSIELLPVYASNYNFNNGLIRFDYSSSSAINTSTGFLNQPFYHSADSNWYKLTYANFPLDYALAEGGDGTSEWNMNGQYNDTQKGLSLNTGTLNIDASELISANGLSYGKIVTSGINTINGKNVQVTNTFELGQGNSFVKISTEIKNIEPTNSLTNLRYWVGTRDDYVGNDDGPTKRKGNIVNGSFAQISSASDRASAIQITTASEGVLFYTTESTANMSVNSCCYFSYATNQNPTTSSITTSGDGSYAMFIRLRDLAPSESQTVVWYYAAGALADLASVVTQVASAASSFSNISYQSATFSATSNVNATGYYVLVPENAVAPTAEQIEDGVDYSGVTVVKKGNAAMTANVAKDFSLAGLTVGGTYKLYFVTVYTDQNQTSQYSNISSATLTLVPYGPPNVNPTGTTTNITKTSATLNGSVLNDNAEGTDPVTETGFCYSTTSTPSTTNGATCVAVGADDSDFSLDISGLQSYTTYYVRAYAKNSRGIGYGTQSSFRTLERTLSTTLTGLSAPVTGAVRPSSFSGTGYTATVVWSPSESDNRFHADKDYTATITITPTTGYDLIGILENSFTLASASTLTHSANSGVLSVSFPRTTYNQVSYNSNGGTSIASVNVDYGAIVPTPTPPTKTGYTFSGWYTNSGLTSAANMGTLTMPGSNLTLYAKWTLNTHNVVFNTQFGTTPASQSTAYGSEITPPATLSEEGYTFRGWYTESTFANLFVFSGSSMPDHVLNLYGKWTANYADVEFNYNNGLNSVVETYAYNQLISLPTTPSRLGYTFAGWYKEAGLINAFDFDSETMPSDGLNLYAKWNPNNYGLSFESSVGTAPSNTTIEYNQNILVPNMSAQGYDFLGWYKDASFTQALDVSVDRMPANALRLYAKWNPITYTISYDYDGGIGSGTSTYTIRDFVTLGTPTKEGYRFLGWFENETRLYGWNPGTIGAKSLVARWEFAPRIPVLGGISVSNLGSDSASISASIVDYGNPKLSSFNYELTNLDTGAVSSGSLGSGLSANLTGLNPYTRYSIRLIATNGVNTYTSSASTFTPKLLDSDNDGIPDVRDAFPNDSTKSFDVTEISPDSEPKRVLMGYVESTQDTQYQLKISEKDLMGLERSDNVLVIMGSVQFSIPVAMVDTILANTAGEDAWLTLKVEPQVVQDTFNENILETEDMNLVAAYDYLLFQVYSDGRETPVHELGGKIKVGIGIGELQGEYDPNNMEVYFYDDENGTIEAMKAVYDPATQSMIFLTEHFSYYVLGVKKEEDPTNTTMQVLFLGIAIGMAIMGFIWWLFSRKKKDSRNA